MMIMKKKEEEEEEKLTFSTAFYAGNTVRRLVQG